MLDYQEKFTRYKNFKNKLRQYFENSPEEWVYSHVSHAGRVDLRIVSNQFENHEQAKEFIDISFEELGSGYRKGLVNYHTVEEAEVLGLTKPIEKEKEPTWEKAVINYINQEEVFTQKAEHRSKIVSFYSYKGGAGRTIALTHTAYLLAKKGKNVLLVDLDIEAPSFYNVFENRMDIEYGLVDYLYEKVFESGNEESKIKITDIFAEIKLNETLKGSIYAIPAGKLSPEYIFKLTQLQPTFISRKDYLSSLIVELEKKLELDIVLIDSRTGINEWGAFSLLDLADDVIFFAYPNKENIGGLKTVMELMKNSGCKSFTTVFSRIDPKGSEVANSLFSELGLDTEQELITIPYETSIAIGSEFPNEAALGKYETLSEFLLEDEIVERNKEYLTEERRERLLESLRGVDYVFPNSLKEKIQRNKWFIIDDEKVLNEYILEFLKQPEDHIYHLLSRDKSKYITSVVEGKVYMAQDTVDYLINSMSNIENSSYTSIWIAYFLFILSSNIECVHKFSEKELSEFISLVEDVKASRKNVMDFFWKVLSIERDVPSEDNMDEGPNFQRDKVIISQDSRIILSDISWIDNVRDSIGCLKGLFECVSFLSEESYINIKILTSKSFYSKYKETFNEFRGNYLELVWHKGDIEGIAKEFIIKVKHELEGYESSDLMPNDVSFNKAYIEDFFKNYSRQIILPSDLIDISIQKILEMYRRTVEIPTDIIDQKVSQKYMEVWLDLFWGIRIVPGKFSKTTSDWFFNHLEKDGEVNPLRALKILRRAVEVESKKTLSNTDRLISLESLKSAFEMEKSSL